MSVIAIISVKLTSKHTPELVDSGLPEILKQVFETGVTYTADEMRVPIVNDFGKLEDRYYDFSYIRIEGVGSEHYGIFCHATNVTEKVRSRKILEESQAKLRLSEERLTATIDVSKVGFYDWNTSDNKIVFSSQMQQDWGIQAGGSLQEVLLQIDIRDRDEVQKLISESIELRRPYRSEYRVNHPNGSTVWIEARGKIECDADSKPVRFFGTSINITERKNAEAALALERYKLETVFQDSPAAMALWRGPDHVFEKVNPHYQAIFGDRNLINKTLLEALPELADQEFPSMLTNVLNTGDPIVGREVLAKVKASDAGPIEDRYYDFTYLRINDPDGNPYGVYDHAVDVTDRVIGRQKLEIAMAAAERASETKSAFLANMSHEIRTPLGAILGFTDLLKDARLTGDEREYLDVISRNGAALSHVIDDILDLSKVEAGQLKIESIPFNLRTLVKDVVTLFSDSARSKELKLSFESDLHHNQLVLSDPIRIRQVLVNLIGNAIKFTSNGGIAISLTEDAGQTTNPVFEIRVRDTGKGISPQQASKLFQPFVQADDSTTRTFGGTGLGLALSRRLANALGGDVIIESSELDKGSTFLFKLNAEISEKAMHEEVELSSPKSRNGGVKLLANRSILVVDDSPDNRVLMQVLLQRNGAKVDEAASGEEAVEKALKNNYDVVLMDIQMPGMDGYDTLAALKELKYAKPVIALTAHAMVEERRRTQAAGFVDHVTKPVDPPSLIAAILKQT